MLVVILILKSLKLNIVYQKALVRAINKKNIINFFFLILQQNLQIQKVLKASF